ncbi:MAG: thrZ [Haloplasmataceae bacterium]|jgi:threonyl-tRNA synthetase|nr:thrZ [Haloplasmataceae bacterium]
MLKITFPDGSVREFEKGVTISDVAGAVSSSLRKKSLAGFVNDVLYDINRPINEDANVRIITTDDQEANEILNHSTAHLLAHAVKRLYPHALFWVGPVVEEGFYYDIDLGVDSLNEEHLVKIEKEMAKIVSENISIERLELLKQEALKMFEKDPYKIDLIQNLDENEIITVYKQNDFVDLCRGPHLTKTGQIKAFKLTKVAGAYFKGDAKNKMLQRIYGIAFFKKEELENYLYVIEEAKKRDHRKLGKELELFMISEYGPGFPFWLPNGMILRRQLEDFWYKVHTKEGYQFIQTPIMLNKQLWETSGHWFNYRENMYTSEIDNLEFAIKPMNCPGGLLVYKNNLHSYKDLPLRVGELGLVHRHEASGALAGLFRVRTFTQDDAHIFCREDQIVDEVANLIKLFEYVYSVFNLNFHIELSTRPLDKYIGSIDVWEKAEAALADACKKYGRTFKVNPGDGAFYGPKLDFKLRDSLGRIWQCGTIQLDMNLPERFDITYIDEKGEKKRPVMLHRAIYGSIERFIGIIIEHYAGAFPLWLAPRQVDIIPVNNEFHQDYAKEVFDLLLDENIRINLDSREEKIGYKIRESQIKKVPYSIVLGDKEKENRQVTFRRYGDQESYTVSLDEFVKLLKDEVKNKVHHTNK